MNISRERDKDEVLSGEDSVMYRVVLEFDPPRQGEKKDPVTGLREINRVELFTDNVHVLYWLMGALNREAIENGWKSQDVKLATAILLEEGKVTWRDENPKEVD